MHRNIIFLKVVLVVKKKFKKIKRKEIIEFVESKAITLSQNLIAHIVQSKLYTQIIIKKIVFCVLGLKRKYKNFMKKENCY